MSAAFKPVAVARRAARVCVTAVGSRADDRLPALTTTLVRGLTIFLYHDITDSPSPFQRASGFYTTPELFTQQLRWILARFSLIKPADLKQFGGSGELPPNAAMITFDDAWAGVFELGLEILHSFEAPSLCFLNMGTVEGDPDLGAVRAYERLNGRSDGAVLRGSIDAGAAQQVLSTIRERYGGDPAFKAFQGRTATPGELSRVATSGRPVWFGSHLYHHWDLRSIAADLYEHSLAEDARALQAFDNTLPAFATPYGYAGRQDHDVTSQPSRLGHRVVFTATGNQNPSSDSRVLDRVSLPMQASTWRDWWYATHRRRFLGSLAS